MEVAAKDRNVRRERFKSMVGKQDQVLEFAATQDVERRAGYLRIVAIRSA